MRVHRVRSTLRRTATVFLLVSLACGGDALNSYGVVRDTTASRYRVRSLVGALSGSSSRAYDINHVGDVVGVSDRRAVRWVVHSRLGAFGPFPLLHPDGSDPGPSEAMAVSDGGLIVGWILGPPMRPFMWTPVDGIRELDLPPGLNAGVAYDLNEVGEIVGSGSEDPAFTRPEDGRVLLWTLDFAADTFGVEDLGTFGGSGARAHAIDGNGRVVGVIWDDGGASRSSFLWSRAGGMQALPLGAEALGLNERGSVVGGWSDRAAVWSGGSVEAVGPPGSLARGLSDFGHIVGEVAGTSPEAARRAFVIRNGEWTLLEGLSALDHSRARAVNGLGIIVGENFLPGDTQPEASYWFPR